MRAEWEKSENAGVQSSNLFITDTKGSKPNVRIIARALKRCHHTFNKQVRTVWSSVTSESREMSAVEKSALGEFRQYWLWAPDWRV